MNIGKGFVIMTTKFQYKWKLYDDLNLPKICENANKNVLNLIRTRIAMACKCRYRFHDWILNDKITNRMNNELKLLNGISKRFKLTYLLLMRWKDENKCDPFYKEQQ